MMRPISILVLTLILLCPGGDTAYGASIGERTETLELSVNEFIHSESRKQVPATSKPVRSCTRRIFINSWPVIFPHFTDKDIIIKTRRLRI